MKFISFFHKDSGALHDKLLMAGDNESQKVDIAAGRVVEPPRPDAGFVWHADVKRWKVSDAVQAKIDARAAALNRIVELEGAQPRAIREYALGFAGALDRLKDIDAEIVALRRDL